MDIRESIKKEVTELRRVRDELKAHLGAADARDAWDRLETQVWPEVEAKLSILERRAGEAKDDVAEATRSLIEEIKAGYKKIRPGRT
jgi:hypothetical protein